MRRKRRRVFATGSSNKPSATTSSVLPTRATPPRSASSRRSACVPPSSGRTPGWIVSSTSLAARTGMAEGKVVIHTDGACSGNPGPGGWGAVLQYNGTVKELKGGEALTTNNRMELTAAISALNALKRKCNVELHTDSVYVKDGLTKWIFGWKKNGWRTADKKPVKNVELWQALDEAVQRHVIDWRWVKGHAGDEFNERADQLANEGMAPFKKKRRGDELMPPV